MVICQNPVLNKLEVPNSTFVDQDTDLTSKEIAWGTMFFRYFKI